MTGDKTTRGDRDPTVLGFRRHFAAFSSLVIGTQLVADRCRHYMVTEGPARETFDYFMQRLSSIRGRYRDLSPIEQDAIWLEVVALEEEARVLRHRLARHEHHEALSSPEIDPGTGRSAAA
jgi:hypothetical protein